MKVTHIIYLSEKPGQNPFSGAENHVATLVAELARRGVDVELLVLVWYPGPQIAARLAELVRCGITITLVERDQRNRWKGRLWRALECWWKLYVLLRRRKHRIVHGHLDLIATAVVARMAGCRVVYSIHNDEPLYRSMLWRLWLRLIDRWIVGYVAITEHVRRYYLVQSGISERKISTIPYGVWPPKGCRIAREDYGIPRGRFAVGFIGRITVQKNVQMLIEAAAVLPAVLFVIVGNGDLRVELEEQVDNRALSNVRFLGAVPKAVELIPLFDVICLPSQWEGLGLVLVESMLQRVPIIASRAGAIPEVLGDGAYGMLHDSGDVVQLVRCLRFAMSNPRAMHRLARAAHRRARTRFAVRRMGQQTCDIYRRVWL